MKVSWLVLTLGFFLVVGMPYAAMGGSVPGVDVDGDSISDNVDNCLGLINPTQDDDDHDGCGNECDDSLLEADFDGSGVVGAGDFGILSGNWNTSPGVPGCAPTCGITYRHLGDADGSGVIGAGDFGVLSGEWNQSSGPSAVVVKNPECK